MIKKRKLGVKGALILSVTCLLGIMFVPVAIVLTVGMAPAIAAGMLDKSEEKLKGMTVGFMNFAGCYPYILTLIARYGNDPEIAFNIIFQPINIVIIYMLAGCGYAIEYGIVRLVAAFLVQSAERRIKDIAKEQEDMVERWGQEVTGDIPLDAHGFAIPQPETQKPAS